MNTLIPNLTNDINTNIAIYKRKYYTTRGAVRKVIHCPKCNKLSLRAYVIALQNYISGTGYVYHCPCGHSKTHIL